MVEDLSRLASPAPRAARSARPDRRRSPGLSGHAQLKRPNLARSASRLTIRRRFRADGSVVNTCSPSRVRLPTHMPAHSPLHKLAGDTCDIQSCVSRGLVWPFRCVLVCRGVVIFWFSCRAGSLARCGQPCLRVCDVRKSVHSRGTPESDARGVR